MKELKELNQELSELNVEKIEVQTEASSEIQVEINRVKAEIDHVKSELRKNHLTDFKKIYDMIEQMTRMCFELYIHKGIDLEFSLSNHVHWINVNGIQYKKYANEIDGELIPNFEETQEVLDHITKIYEVNMEE